MATITAIKPQRSKKRVNIYLDGKFGFGLDLENFVKLGLKVEQELSENEVAEIIKKGELQKTSDKLIRYATIRPRSEKEVKDYVKRKKVHESIHTELFDRLKRLELLDDTKFAKWWVEQRLSFKPKGERALMAELMQKGINRTLAQEVVTGAQIDEKGLATKLLEKKVYRWQSLEKFEKKKKMGEFLGRKGFGWDVIEEVVKRYVD